MDWESSLNLVLVQFKPFQLKLAKESKTKNEQSTDVMYSRILVHYGHLVFLLPVIRAAENKDALKLNAETMCQEETE